MGKNFLKIKLVECQQILQEYQTKWDVQYQLLRDHHSKKNKVEQLKMNLIKERKYKLSLINNEVHEQIEIKLLQRDIANTKQMYIFTINSADLHSLKQKLQHLGKFVDLSQSYKNNGKLSKAFNIKKKKKSKHHDRKC